MKYIGLVIVAFISGCGSTDTPYGVSTFARINVVNSAGRDPVCENMVDISYSIKNADYSAKAFGASLMREYALRERIHSEFIENEYPQLFDDYLESIYPPLDYSAYDFHITIESAADIAFGRNDDSAEETDLGNSKDDTPAETASKNSHDDFNGMVDMEIDRRLDKALNFDENDLYRVVLENPRTKRTNSPNMLITTNDDFRHHYVSQRSENTCFAASLTNIWSYFGWPVDYDQFLTDRVPYCELPKNSSASFIEIIQTAMNVRIGEKIELLDYKKFRNVEKSFNGTEYTQTLIGGSLQETSFSAWYVEKPLTGLKNVAKIAAGIATLNAVSNYPMNDSALQPAPSGLNLFGGFSWNYTNEPKKEGQIRPIVHAGDITQSLADGHAIMVGVLNRNGGHTYLVTGVEYEPDFEFNDLDTFSMSPGTKITRIRLLDPGEPNNPEKWFDDMKEFFANYRFGIVFTDPGK